MKECSELYVGCGGIVVGGREGRGWRGGTYLDSISLASLYSLTLFALRAATMLHHMRGGSCFSRSLMTSRIKSSHFL